MKGPFLAIIPAVLALSGCTNLQAVSTLSESLMTASATWNDVGEELNASCVRLLQFNPLLDCPTPAAASSAIVATNTVLANYFTALHDAANADNFTVQPGLDALAASAASIPGVKAEEVDAVSGLARTLAGLWTEHLRERALRSLIKDGAPAAMTTIGLLQRTVPHALQTTLAAEREGMNEQFTLYIERGGGAPPRPLATMCAPPPRTHDFSGPNFLLALEYCRRLGDLDQKEKALDAYTTSLDEASKALIELNSGKTRLGGKALAVKLHTIGKTLNDDLKAVHGAFAKGKSA